MEAATVPAPAPAAAVQKRLFRNNTAGWLGVISLSPKGDSEGIAVEPYGTVWLSHDEVVLTARAPRRPEDNPFELQTFVGVDPDNGQRREFQLRPLTMVPEEEARALPYADRYVPTEDAPQGAAPPPASAPTGGTDVTDPPVPATPDAAAAAAAAVQAPVPGAVAPPVQQTASAGIHQPLPPTPADSWVTPPEAPGEVLPGSLQGDNTAPAEEQPPPTAPPVAGQGQIAPEAPGATVVAAEEHAAAVDPSIGEETGAARPPASPQPEGEYASAEEVGSPDAPANNEPTQNGG